jgi:hypothetical protein
MVALARKAAEAVRNARSHQQVQATLAGETAGDLPGHQQTQARVRSLMSLLY